MVCTGLPDGMAEIWALLSADGAAQLMTTLNSVAAGEKHLADGRTADQRRADALVALAAQRLTDPTLPAWRGRRPSVQVIVNASTLLGTGRATRRARRPRPDPRRHRPGHRGRPVRHLAAAAHRPRRRAHRLQPAPTPPPPTWPSSSPPGTAPAASPAAREAPAAAKSTTSIAWDDNGPTVPEQPRDPLLPASPPETRDRLERRPATPPANLTWTSPTGHTYRSPPNALRLTKPEVTACDWLIVTRARPPTR